MRTIKLAFQGLIIGGLVSGCAITEPVVVIGINGQTLKGTTTASLAGGSFTVTDGKLTCGGNYSVMNMNDTINIMTICSDGRKGFVIANRDPGEKSGRGTVHLNDGTTGTFIFGPGADNF